jgi:hypothetical protein
MAIFIFKTISGLAPKSQNRVRSPFNSLETLLLLRIIPITHTDKTIAIL